ncbi:TrmB family transcriptional regulator [Candidatus Peregrinibacteria bacterium]|nr:MAG: TrmB family transcriptional regulator [Candidatus Peregrinibacteria bacterium]
MIDKSKLISLLQKLNFSRNEALVYLTLLELNEAIPSTLAQKTGQKRPNCYMILEKLRSRGVVTSVKKKNLIHFQAIKPEYFLERERSKTQEIEKSLTDLASALPELLSLHQRYTATPQMSVYYGKEGLIQVMEETLNTKEDLLCWANADQAFSSLEDYYPRYIKKKVTRKIWVRGIFAMMLPEKIPTKRKKELREIYLTPKDEFPFKNEINIYDDKVAIISHEDQIGVIIQNQHIADSQKAIFNFVFKQVKKQYKPNIKKTSVKSS